MLKHINLSDQVEQWQGLKDIIGVESDRDPAKYLIDSYLESQTPPSLADVIFEIPVKRQQIEKQKVSTPIVGSKRLPSDPQISSVTEWSDSHEEKGVEAAHYDCSGHNLKGSDGHTSTKEKRLTIASQPPQTTD